MDVPDRYEALKRWDERCGVETHEGKDSATGLPVLIYQFEGEPQTSPGLLAGENLPEVVWSGSDGDRGSLIAKPAEGYRRTRTGDPPLEPGELLDAARAVRDAAAAGLVHGDIRPERLLRAKGRLQIEGYGVPWRNSSESGSRPSEQGDVQALATAVERMGTTISDDTVAAVLELCRAADPNLRPSPEELYLALEQLLGHDAAPPPDTEERAERPPEWLPGGASQKEWRRQERRRDDWRQEEWWKPREEAQGEAGRTSAEEPGGNGDYGSLVDPRERTRRLAMLGVLIAAIVALALLALYGPQAGRSPVPPREATVYVVEVSTAPEGLPPVTIHLVSSPPGSNLARGDRLGTAPRHLALDRAGTWAFQGSLQDRRSDIVEIEVPEQRSFTLFIPPGAGGNP